MWATRILLWVGALLILGGCATPTTIKPQVVTHSRWDATRQPGTFAFERLPSQDGDLTAHAQLEAAALPALLRLGFTPAVGDPDFVVQLQVQVRTERDAWSRHDPFWNPYWGWYSGRPGLSPGLWGPTWRAGGGHWAPLPPPPPLVRMQANVLIRERRSGQALYESLARYDRVGSGDARLWPALFDAALRRFPQATGEPVEVEVPRLPLTPPPAAPSAAVPTPAAPAAALPPAER